MTVRKFFIFSMGMVLLGIISCNQKQHNLEDIIEIQVSFIKGHMERSTAIECSTFPDGTAMTRVIDTTLSSEAVLNQIKNHLRELKTIDDYSSPDVRIKCIIVFSDKETKTLCLGDLGGTMFNDQVVEDNLELAFLIKENSGYYNYYPQKFLPSFPELQDSLRLKEILSKNRLPAEQLNGVESDSELVEISF